MTFKFRQGEGPMLQILKISDQIRENLKIEIVFVSTSNN